MSIGLTQAEVIWCQSAVDDDTGSITSNIDTYTQSLVALRLSSNDSSGIEAINKKFYDYWTTITTSAEYEMRYGRGYYCTPLVTESDITNAASGITSPLFPFTSGWVNLYPYRVAALYVPVTYTSSCEYGELVIEGNNQGSDFINRDNRHDALYAQKSYLENVRPYILQLIVDASSELTKYAFLSTIITDASTALVNLDSAYASVLAAIADPDHKSVGRLAYITTRKNQLIARYSQIASTFGYAYDYRYQWLDLRVNMQYGSLGNYVSTGKSIVIINEALVATTSYKATIEAYV
jgi:hypothetical protein